jgi:hypothetical protein
MNRRERWRGTGILWGLFAAALAYLLLLYFLDTLTGNDIADGASGVLLGLYVCSRPAANAVDLLFYGRHALREAASGWSGAGWLALNALVMFAGWFVIWIGAVRFTGGRT